MPLNNPSQPCIQHQTVMRRWDDLPLEDLCRSIKITVHEGFSTASLLRGPHASYIGSTTRIKRSISPVVLVNPDPADKVALSVAELMSWVSVDEHLTELLASLIREKTLTPVDVVIDSASRIVGGSFEHRGAVMLLSQGIHINFNPSVMSFMDINTDTATMYGKKGVDYTIIFQELKVRAASFLMHRQAIRGESVCGEWAMTISCDTCTAEIYTGMYSLSQPSVYRGVPFGLEHHMVFKPEGAPLTVLHPNTPTYERDMDQASHVYLAEEIVTSAVQFEALDSVTEHIGVTGAGEFTTSTRVNLTNVAKSNIRLLMLSIIQRILIRPHFYHLKASYASIQDFRPANPCILLIDPIFSAGRGNELSQLIQDAAFTDIKNHKNRTILMARLMIHLREDAISQWFWVMHNDSKEAILQAIIAKAGLSGQAEQLGTMCRLTEGELTVKMHKYKLRVLPGPQECHVHIRNRKEPPVVKCRLQTPLVGHCGCEPIESCDKPLVYHNNSTTFGTSVAASQVWTILPLYPTLPIWTVGDWGGKVGVVAGHRSVEPCYIADPSSRRWHKHQINNGPIALFSDPCTQTFNRDYYIANLGSRTPQRPTFSPLVIIVVSCSSLLSHVGSMLQAGDVILSKYKHQLCPFIYVGYPRRGPQDVWWGSRCFSNHELDGSIVPDDVGCQEVETMHLSGTTLSPHVRACSLLGIPRTSSLDALKENCMKKVELMLEESLMTHETLARGGMIGLLREVADRKMQGSVRFEKREDILLIMWMIMRLRGKRRYLLLYHVTEHGLLHDIDVCSCKVNKKDKVVKTYKPYDELMAYYLSSVCDNNPYVADEDGGVSGGEEEDDDPDFNTMLAITELLKQIRGST